MTPLFRLLNHAAVNERRRAHPPTVYDVPVYGSSKVDGRYAQAVADFGILKIFPALGRSDGFGQLGTLRVRNTIQFEEFDGPLDPTTTTGRTPHREALDLLSLEFGVRLFEYGQSHRQDFHEGIFGGEPTRFDRPVAMPLISARMTPASIPALANRSVDLEQATLIKRFARLTIDDAGVLARAAGLYANALRIADLDPHSAYILLVAALEAGASSVKGKPKSIPERWADLRMDNQFRQATEGVDPSSIKRLVKLLSNQARAGWKFRQFVLARLDDLKELGQHEPWREVPLDEPVWMEGALARVYGIRSRFVHQAEPVPGPLLSSTGAYPHSPRSDLDSLSIQEGESEWEAKDLSFTLAGLEAITRLTLLAYASGLEERDEMLIPWLVSQERASPTEEMATALARYQSLVPPSEPKE